MKFIISFLFALSITSIVCGDPGPAYLFKIEVTYDKGKAMGYFWNGSVHYDSNEGKSFANDSLFFDYLLSWNYDDSLSLFQEVYFVDSLDIQIYFKDKLLKIDESKIRKIHLMKIIETGFGNWISPERFETKDLVWLKKPYVKKELLFDESCDLDIYFFEQPDKAILEKIEKLKHESSEKYSEMLHDFLKTLEKSKVVIRSYCSC